MFPEAPVPRRIGDYQIVRRIRAEGPFEVYLAKEQGPHGFEREVTLRCAKRDPDDAVHAEELAREARICTRLNHPSIAKVIGFFEDGDRLVLVLEHIEGTTLQNLLLHYEDEHERLPDPVSAYVASSVANALAAAHALLDENGSPTPILHRALSPSVVHIARDGTVKLGGFSLAKILDRTPDSAVALVGGSGGFVAPERIRGEPSTERSDVWALGVLTFRLFAGSKGSRHVIQAMAGRPPSLSSVREGIARELTAAIDAALHDDPNKRTISCAELARWIARVAPLDDGKRELKSLMEEIPEENDGEPQPVDRASRRKMRQMERNSPKAKLGVLRARDSEMEVSSSEVQEISKVEELPQPPPPRVPTPAPKIPTPAPKPAIAAKVPPPPPRIPTPLPKVAIPTPKPIPQTAPQFGLEAPEIEVKGARPPAARAATLIGMAPQIPKPPVAKLDVVAPKLEIIPDPKGTDMRVAVDIKELPEPAVEREPPPPPPAPMLPVIGPLTKPALQPSNSRPNEVVRLPPPVGSLDETTELPRVRRRNMMPIVIAIVAALALFAVVAAVITLSKKKPVADDPVAVKPKATAVKTSEPEPPASATTTAPSAIVAKTAPGKYTPPPGKKLPTDFGWLVVHGMTPGTRVFAAGRSRGEPEQVIMVPCGKLFVTIAKVDSNGKWRGWAGKGASTNVACNGTITEMTISP